MSLLTKLYYHFIILIIEAIVNCMYYTSNYINCIVLYFFYFFRK